MPFGFIIENGGTTSDSILHTINFRLEDNENTQDESLINGNDFVVEADVIDPTFAPNLQIRTGPVDTWDGTTATRTHTVRDKTPEELAANQIADDLAVLREAGKDLALVLTELVQWTLDNTSMLPTDFTESVRTAYIDLKVIADRVKGV